MFNPDKILIIMELVVLPTKVFLTGQSSLVLYIAHITILIDFIPWKVWEDLPFLPRFPCQRLFLVLGEHTPT
jgi:hypothetical protein